MSSTNFDCLFVSYANISEDHTSWVDLIAIKDLEEAILKGGADTSIKLVNLATMKYIKAECYVRGGFSDMTEKTLNCDLVFEDTEHNTKEDIELGTLCIAWDCLDDGTESVKEVIYKSPRSIKYRANGEREYIEPEFAYLKHSDNSSNYFLFENYKGTTSRKEEIFYVEEFEKTRLKFGPIDYAGIYKYVSEEVDKLTELSIGTRWPSPWPKELHILYDVLQDETEAAYFLSGLVQKAVLASKYEWTVCKVRIYNRLYFCRTDKLKEE